MKCLINYTVLFIFLAIFIQSCGSLGHIKFYDFKVSKPNVEQELLSIINRDSMYIPPEEWNGYELGMDSIYDIFIFFKDLPKEIYLVRFTDRKSWDTSDNCRLGLVGRFDGRLWYFENNLNTREENRVIKRFENEIIQKIKYKYTTSE